MKRLELVLLAAIMFLAGSAMGQQQLKHENSRYVGPEGKLYINMDLPIYLYLSTEKGSNTNHHRLKSRASKYADPLYLDEEGLNTIRSPWRVDPETREVIQPKKDVVFEVYSDSTAPESDADFKVAPEYKGEKEVYYGKNLKIALHSQDQLADVKQIYYSINGSSYKKYNGELAFSSKNGHEYTLKYYAVDNVGNAEKAEKNDFIVDEKPPEPQSEIEGLVVGNNKTNENAKLVINASDNLSGVDHVQYYIDENPFKTYQGPVDVASLSNGMHTLYYNSVDHVENKRQKKQMEFEIDKLPPETDIEIRGDQHEGDHHFISQRARIAILADDKQSEIERTGYGINEKVFSDNYDSPFNIDSKAGLKIIKYASEDVLKNRSATKTKTVYLDKKAPATEIVYNNPKYSIDKFFINKNTTINLHAGDQESGLNRTEYKVDDNSWETYSGGITVDEEGEHTISFRSYDRVNNQEEAKSSSFFVDNTAPEIFVNFSVDATGKKTKEGNEYKAYPRRSKLFFGATDKHCGTQNIYYSVNGGKLEEYATGKNIDIAEQKGLTKSGFYEVEVVAEDKLGNRKTKNIKFFIRQ